MSEEPLPEFGKMEYWDDGYKTGEAPAEWFIPYQTFAKFVRKHVPKDKSVLVIGCGTSSLSNEMYEEGYTQMSSMDYSPEAIEEMKIKYPHLKWSVMDVRKMEYADGEFDSIVDKGTLDCLFFLDETNGEVKKMLGEVSRVLKPGGRYVVVTCGHPMQRTDVFLSDPKFKWNITDWKEYLPPDGSFTHPSAFVYCLTKDE
ncbi:endothelin-converting enzyme 2-like protein [Tritrichomonas foetus]|uniref:Endothelin-converting enzyme 2-like protein n=1 Tax=Tritrichomonas foetus TaxID=1144522 RepID=A0A1J4L4P7_9EUKA|nr:endothelin-converting enzyme 2-like protein [Tritrichomonas foetus]|eukprot:OHT16902.1 endothelin-converting enzyme 2-like protein [Tritrichomonas foetus]